MTSKKSKTKENFYLKPPTADKLGICLFKYQLSPNEKFVTTNLALAKILHFHREEEILKKKLKSFFVRPTEATKFIKTLKKEKTIRFFEAQFKTKDNKEVWVAITASLSASPINKKQIFIEGILENISEHKELEERFALEKQLFQNLLDNLPDAIYFKDANNKLVRVNQFYANGFKKRPEELIGKSDFDFFPKDQAQRMFDDDTYVLKSGHPIIGKIERTLLPNGTYNCVTTTKIPVRDNKGKNIGTMGITRDITNYDKTEKSRLSMVMSSLKVLDKVLEIKDPYTFGHTRRVSIIAEKIAQELGWEENRILELRISAELHDIGKILVPLEILNKPGKLSDLELKMIQEHVKNCYNMLKPHTFPFPMPEAIYQHHERLDGKGYPRGLLGVQIIPEARILAISDVLEAMTYHRPYRAALGIKKAIEELQNNAGTKYDGDIVETALRIIQENNHEPFWITQNSDS